MTHVVLIDNRDSFVYNLVDALAGFDCTVYRNSVSPEQLRQAQPDLIVLSPGPGHPREAGNLMAIIDAFLGEVPILGICLGFQALLDHHGGDVVPCGPVHGKSVPMTLTDAGTRHPVFQDLTIDTEPDQPDHVGRMVPVARYHSLGCTQLPSGMVSLATTGTDIGEVTMAAQTDDGRALGVQFHPESVLSPMGPIMITRFIEQLCSNPVSPVKEVN